MSDREIRQVLEEVIADIDAGRVGIRRGPRWRGLGAMVGGSAVAVSIAFSLGACGDEGVLYAAPPVDAQMDARVDARVDAGSMPDYGAPPDARVDAQMDARPQVDVDIGPMDAYGVPFPDADVDAGPMGEDGAPPDGGQ